jgi:hypothetical protein
MMTSRRDGSIPSCLIGGRRVVRTSDLEGYVASLPVSPVGAASGTSAEVTGQETGRPVDIRAMSADEAAAHLANMRLAVADMVRSQDA